MSRGKLYRLVASFECEHGRRKAHRIDRFKNHSDRGNHCPGASQKVMLFLPSQSSGFTRSGFAGGQSDNETSGER